MPLDPTDPAFILFMAKWGLVLITLTYVGMMLTEIWLYRRYRPEAYDPVDAFGSYSVNLLSNVVEVVIRGVVPLALYLFVYAQFRLFPDAGFAWWTFVIAFFVHEIAYFIGHMVGHRTGLGWAFHQVHHSSEELNISTAARGTLFGDPLAQTFASVAALMAVHPLVYFTVAFSKNLWGIFNHTQLVDKMGWMERWFATPANHRVHHGRNPQYIDRNYGQVLIVWDRLAGTWEPEGEPPDFGLVTPQHTTNPLRIWLGGWIWLRGRIRSAERLSDKLRYLYKPPEWHHAQTRSAQTQNAQDQSFATRART